MDRRGPRTRRCLRRRQPDHRRHAFHGVSVVGWTACESAHRKPASRGGRGAAEAMDLGASRAAREFTGELGRQALLRRRRTRAMDPELPAIDGSLAAPAAVAVYRRRFVVRSALGHLGVQYRSATWPPAGLYRARYP